VLHRFIISHRETIIANARARAGSRMSPRPIETGLTNGIPLFLDHLGDALRLAQSSPVIDHAALSESACKHGGDLHRSGLTIGQAVHDYGDICQSIIELAAEARAPLSGDELRVLNMCLDDATAGAVTEYARHREVAMQTEGTERLGVLAHELRGVLSTATLAYGNLQTGKVGIGGSIGQLLGRSLLRLSALIDISLADVRLDAGIGRAEQFLVAGFVEEIAIGASMQAQVRGIHFTVPPVAEIVAIEGDRQVLISAISNLLQNAFKFTCNGGSVTLTTRVTTERVIFDIEDECGGLPPGKIEELFTPFSQRGTDRTGVGLGLSICLKAAKANAGDVRVRDLPGKGCVFTLELPRKPTLSNASGGNSTSELTKAGHGANKAGPVKARAIRAPIDALRIHGARGHGR
jgi:signal transduction histidine kinase